MRLRLVFFTSLVLVLFSPELSRAGWLAGGIRISTSANADYYPKIATDGAAGAIITWSDSGSDITAQRVNFAGDIQWAADGLSLGLGGDPQIISDGNGGAIVVWWNFCAPQANLYLQRLNASGVATWTAGGVPLLTQCSFYPEFGFGITPDGVGGFIVAWVDLRSGSADIYAQRVNGSGTPVWTTDGVAVCLASGAQRGPQIVSDGSAGAIVMWVSPASGGLDIYTQRVNAAGTALWTLNGVALCSATGEQSPHSTVSDGAGGAIAVWDDYRVPTNPDIYARRVDAGGTPQWASNGVVVCSAAGDQSSAIAVSDGSGGVIASWTDARGANQDVYAQRLNGTGAPQWAANGVVVSSYSGNQQVMATTSDDAGGAIIVWQDDRNGLQDIYAARVNGTGASMWTPDGVPVCNYGGSQAFPVIVSDGAAGALVAWEDDRFGSDDIYAARVYANGNTLTAVGRSPAAGALTLRDHFPNPFSTTTTLDVQLVAPSMMRIDMYDVAGRRVGGQSYPEMSAGWHSVQLQATDGTGQPLPAGVYFYTVHANESSATRKMVVVR